MWHCNKCREQADDNFEVCWNCGTSREGVEDPSFRRAEHIRADEMEMPVTPEPADEAALEEPDDVPDIRRPDLTCLRCGSRMSFLGAKSFHEGFGWDWVIAGNINQEKFDVFACQRCGKVELFLSGRGKGLASD